MSKDSAKFRQSSNGTIDLTFDDSYVETRGVIDLTNDEPVELGLRGRLRSARRTRPADSSIERDEVDTLGSVLAERSSTTAAPLRRRPINRRLVVENPDSSVVHLPPSDSPDVILLNEQSTDDFTPVPRKKPRKLSPSKTPSTSGSQQTERTSLTGGFCCPICLDTRAKIIEEGRYLSSTTCGHVFCNECIDAAIKRQSCCPTCRKKLNKRSVHRLYL